jgi:hypothetical protein
VIAGFGGSSNERRPTGTPVVPGIVATDGAPPSLVTLGDEIVDTGQPVCKCTAGVAVVADRVGARFGSVR